MWRNNMKVRDCFTITTRRRGQANIVMMVIVLLMVFAIFFFLLQLLQKPPEPALDNLYVHNMLLSIMRTDTGYQEENCKTVSDVVVCSFFEPYYKCGDRVPCKTVAESRIQGLLETYGNVKKNRKYYLEAKAEGRVVSWMGRALEIKIGDETVEDSPQKITANEKIQKLFRGEAYTINVRLSMAERKAD